MCVCVHVCVSSLKYGMDFAIFIGYVVYYLWGEGGGQFCSTEQEPPPFPFLRSLYIEMTASIQSNGKRRKATVIATAP